MSLSVKKGNEEDKSQNINVSSMVPYFFKEIWSIEELILWYTNQLKRLPTPRPQGSVVRSSLAL